MTDSLPPKVQLSASRRVVTVYAAVTGLFTLAASLIWAINTLFLLRTGGLDLFEVMVANATFTLASLVFEVPTGVIADTLGRRVSMLLCSAILMMSTVLYVLTPRMGWGLAGFVVASAALGLGFTFQTGAADAWLVDALDFAGHEGPKERAFATGQVAAGTGMLLGSLLGGVLGQSDLSWPFVVRAFLLAVTFVVTLAFVRDEGFTPRPLRMRSFGDEARKVFAAGVRFGWRNPVIKPLLWISGCGGVFYMFAFYAWQPYMLALLGLDAVWLLGVVQAGFSAAGIIGNSLVGRIMRAGEGRRDPARVLAGLGGAEFGVGIAIAVVGLIWRVPGVVPAAIVITLWLAWGFIYGVYGPVRMAYLNAHIPSSQRATVISLDAFFADGGAAVGQPALGWISRRQSISVAWLIGAAGMAVAAPLYLRSGAAARAQRAGTGDE